jgi:dihydrofolate reductase
MASASIRIFGYAIISAEGMIADADGRMPDSLLVEADQSFFRASLTNAQVVVHGRHSGEGGPDANRRHRVILTSTIAAMSSISSAPHVLLWNPKGISFTEITQSLPINEGIVAVIGGTNVFDLFLSIGYDAFYLSCSARARLLGGRPVFSRVPEQSPQRILANHGLCRRREQNLGNEVTLEEWIRESPQ